MGKVLGAIIGYLVVLFSLLGLSLLVSFLGAYVVLQIGLLYNLSFITQFTFAQMYGIFCVIALLSYKYEYKDRKEESKKTLSESISNSLTKMTTKSLCYLLAWGVSYVVLNILAAW